MIYLLQMRHFMGHHIVAHDNRARKSAARKKTSDRAVAAGAPAAFGVAHRDARRPAPSRAAYSRARAANSARASRLKKSSRRARRMFEPAADQNRCRLRVQTGEGPACRAVADGMAHAQIGHHRARHERHLLRARACSWRDIHSVSRRAKAIAGPAPPRAGAVTMTSPVAGLTRMIIRRARGLKRTETATSAPSTASNSRGPRLAFRAAWL